jgi:hypothetical protein
MMLFYVLMLSPSMSLFVVTSLSMVCLERPIVVRIGLCFMLGEVVSRLGKVRLFVRVREQGCRIESVPLKRLVKLSGYHKRRWDFVDGWLILEGF